MNKNFENQNAKVAGIANIMVADVIEDVDLLTVALCAGCLEEISHTIFLSNEGEDKHTAAHRALDLGWNPVLRERKVRAGYFEKGLRGLIDLSKRNPDAGSRLMPIFCEMVSDPSKYGLPKILVRETVRYMEAIRERDGFAIVCMNDDGKVVVKPARSLCKD